MTDGPSTGGVRAAADGPEVFVADEQEAVALDPTHLGRLAAGVLAAQGVRVNGELALYFVDESVIADLNERFMGVTGPTDVLAFPIDEEPELGGAPDTSTTGPDRTPDDVADIPVLLGDVFVCPAVAARNAAEHDGTVDDELALLVVHGILHVLGMDHADDQEAAAMQARERELLARLHHRS